MQNPQTTYFEQFSILHSISAKNMQSVKGKYHNLSLQCQTKPSVKPLLKEIENKFRMEQTDMEAFKLKCFMLGITSVPETFKLINSPNVFSQQVTLTDLRNLSFPVLSYSLKDLCRFSGILLQNCACKQIEKKLKIDLLVNKIALNYNIVAYHNFSHGFSLMLLFHQSLQREPNLRNRLTGRQKFYAYVAALAHDLNHNGTNNGFEIKRNTAIAQKYNNESVLENMHLNHLWGLLRENQDINFLKILTISEANEARKLITRLIMATDISKHFKNIEVLRELAAKQTICSMDEESIYFLTEQIFHACDIGNLCIDFEIYMNWSSLLSFQFHQQSKIEQSLGIEISPFLRFTSMKAFYKGQIGFIGTLVLPIWKQLSSVCRNMQEMIKTIEQNVKKIQQKIQQEDLKSIFL